MELKYTNTKIQLKTIDVPTWCIIFTQCIIIIIKLMHDRNMTYHHVHRLPLITFLPWYTRVP